MTKKNAKQLTAPPNSLFEVCEERLVLSAQALVDAIAELSSPVENAVPIEPHLSEAHAGTGLASVVEQFGLTGRGQTVAVIDSGIAWDHVALGQGYGPGYRVVGGWDFAENDDQPYDDGPSGFHGTHVSGVIGSSDAQHPGVARDVDLVSLRVFDDIGQGQLDWVENALQWVHDHRNSFENPITAVNISVGALDGGQALSSLEDELQQLYQDGIVVTASAGNSFKDLQTTELSYPASSQYVLPVASVDANGNLSSFSQRDARVLAAPGEAITSSVPDHVLGKDGRIDDFTGSSGTSMAAPYVAGASVLVRQAMEMVGYGSIDTNGILDHLHATADSVFDSITGQSYDRLNLQEAISSLIPVDEVSDSALQAQTLDFGTVQGGGLDVWVNQLQDVDQFQFVASGNGSLRLDADSLWNDGLGWRISSGGTELASAGLEATSFEVIAGQQYQLSVFSEGSIGPGTIDFDFQPEAEGSSDSGQSVGDSGNTPGGFVYDSIGAVEYFSTSANAGAGYAATASQDGIFTILWENPDSASGAIQVSSRESNNALQEWNEGSLRLDFEVQAGQQIQFQLPGSSSDIGELTLVNLVRKSGTELIVGGTGGQDNYHIDLTSGIEVVVRGVDYSYANHEVNSLRLDAGGSGDTLSIQGSDAIESVELRPGATVVENQQVQLDLRAAEDVSFSGGGNSDRIYVYDSAGDDTLRAYPGRAELVGAGFRFEVDDVSRIFVHATGTGEDLAYIYDSSGDDQLSARPQFTSVRGEGYFNYVRGFERVYAYANAGGHDVAALYDSAGADRFSAAGENVLISGPGFSSHVRGFEEVNAHAHAGGEDRATLYGSNAARDWYRGTDYVSFQEGNSTREARGFEQVETYANSQPISIIAQSVASETTEALAEREALDWDESNAGASSTLIRELGIHAQTLSREEMEVGRLYLPEEELLHDMEKEREVLHEVFSRYGRQGDSTNANSY